MSRKLSLTLGSLALATAISLLFWWLVPKNRKPQDPPIGTVAGVSLQSTSAAPPSASVPAFSQDLLRKVPNATERWRRLERLGYVPDDADEKDWWLAQKTSWWGKRLDPNEFWKGRTLWADTSAAMAARRRGRVFPPIPQSESRFEFRSDADQSTMPSSEGDNLALRYSDRENVYWGTFAKTHPRPPEQIAGAQQDVARQILGGRYHFEHEGNPGRLTDHQLDGIAASERSNVQGIGYPPEAFTDEALKWAYIFAQRELYEKQFMQKSTANTLWSSNFLARTWVDPTLITDPLTDSQLQAADAWKTAYLRRLRHDKTNETYIAAYLQSWNLSSNDVFGSGSEP
jgi:hypothetical protein